VLLRVNEQRNILHEISKRKANWIGHILRRNCLLKRVIELKIKGGIKVRGRWGRRLRKLLDDLQERRVYSHLKREALDRTMWIARFGRGFGPVVRQTTKWMNELLLLFCVIILTSGVPSVSAGSMLHHCFLQLSDLLLCLSRSQWPPFQIALKYMRALFLRFHYRSEETCELTGTNGLITRFKEALAKSDRLGLRWTVWWSLHNSTSSAYRRLWFNTNLSGGVTRYGN